ncbi:MAG: hypothetical protein ACQESP_06880 [Candidatus Muiribacteriota bacterium]
MLKRTITILLVMIFLGNLIFAEDGKNALQLELHSLVSLNWEVTNQLHEDNYNLELVNKLESETEQFTDYLIEAVENDRTEVIETLKEEYAELDTHSQNFIYSEIISKLNEYSRNNGLPAYLPGYGYQQSDYVYQLGSEIDSELVHSYWKREHRVLQSNNKYRFYVKMEIAAEMGAEIGGGAQGGIFNITGSAHFEVNGKVEEFAETEISTVETVETDTIRLYENRRVEFEVLRAPKNNPDNWEVDGSCFLNKEFPGETEIVLDAEDIFNF